MSVPRCDLVYQSTPTFPNTNLIQAIANLFVCLKILHRMAEMVSAFKS